MLHRVVWYTFTGILEECTVPIYRVEKWYAACFLLGLLFIPEGGDDMLL
jgi:hypothetical protein